MYYNEDENGNSGGNGLYILAPTPALVKYANDNESYNDISYVILYKVYGKRILFGGDADNETWNYLLENCPDDIKDIDLLIAPHHGRKSSCSYEFLRTTRPKMTFFGNTDKASHLATDMFRNLKLPVISNNQGNCLIGDIDSDEISLFVTCKEFAQKINSSTSYNSKVGGFFIGNI
jgi:competence protein ComEC